MEEGLCSVYHQKQLEQCAEILTEIVQVHWQKAFFFFIGFFFFYLDKSPGAVTSITTAVNRILA